MISPLLREPQVLKPLVACVTSEPMAFSDPSHLLSDDKVKIYVPCIINVGMMLILGLTRKQNGRPIGYITLVAIISRPKWKLSHVRALKFIYGLLPMTKLAEPFMAIRNTSKISNRNVAKSQIVLFLILDKSFALV